MQASDKRELPVAWRNHTSPLGSMEWMQSLLCLQFSSRLRAGFTLVGRWYIAAVAVRCALAELSGSHLHPSRWRPFTQWAFSAALLARYSACGSDRMMDSGRFCQSEWVLNDTQRHNRHAEGSSRWQKLGFEFLWRNMWRKSEAKHVKM